MCNRDIRKADGHNTGRVVNWAKDCGLKNGMLEAKGSKRVFSDKVGVETRINFYPNLI